MSDITENQLPAQENEPFSIEKVEAQERQETRVAREIPPRPGTLLRKYHKQRQQKQTSHLDGQDATIADSVGADAAPDQGWSWPSPQSWPSFGQKLITSTMRAVRDFSGKFTAVATPAHSEPEPLVLYHPPATPMRQFERPRTKPWRSSRAVRTAMLMRNRRKRWKKARPKKGKIWAG